MSHQIAPSFRKYLLLMVWKVLCLSKAFYLLSTDTLDLALEKSLADILSCRLLCSSSINELLESPPLPPKVVKCNVFRAILTLVYFDVK